MPGKHLFEYAVIRIVPRVERGEFLNAGVILYCADQQFLQTMYAVDTQRLQAFCAKADGPAIVERLEAFVQICRGATAGGPIGQLPLASRFRWLTAARSTIVQTSPVHSGLCDDALETLQRLHGQLVG